MLERFKKITQLPLRTVTANVVGRVFGSAVEHHFTDRVLNVASPIWRPPFPWQRFKARAGYAHIETLRRDGIVVLPPFLNGAALREIHDNLKTEFDRRSEHIEFKAKGRY